MAAAPGSDVELCQGAAYDEVSEASGLNGWVSPRLDARSTPARGRLVRAAAAVVAVAAGLLLLCLLGARTGILSRSAAASASGVVGLGDEGERKVVMALRAAEEEKHLGNLSTAPLENLHDGNPCNDDEEYYVGLCYAKCSLLTGGEYIHRQSPWTCCNQAVCDNWFALGKCCKHNAGFCSGYSIAGLAEGDKICPHKPGACLVDEELFLNVCYMKCSLLTGGQYPYRTAAATCCTSRDARCMLEDGFEDGMDGTAVTNASLAVGGGCGDRSNLTHCEPHLPDVALTEQ